MSGLLGLGFALVVLVAVISYMKWVLTSSYNTRVDDPAEDRDE